jgi:hypothetical protein
MLMPAKKMPAKKTDVVAQSFTRRRESFAPGPIPRIAGLGFC